MRILLEDFVPYDQSACWLISDAYYAARGLDAWTSGEIPFDATSNYVLVRNTARVLCAFVDELLQSGRLAEDAPFYFLEIASGHGLFAVSLFRALKTDCGEAGLRVERRLRYLMSDFSEQTIRQALDRPDLAPLIASGQVIGVRLDLRNPDGMRLLDGGAPPGPISFVLANYICCAVPPKSLMKSDGTWSERHVRASFDAPDESLEAALSGPALVEQLIAQPTMPKLMESLVFEAEFCPARLDQIFAHSPHGGLHADVARRAAASMPKLFFTYPMPFFDCFLSLAGRLAPWAIAFVSDYGEPAFAAANTTDSTHQFYGNSICHSVSFALFDALAAEAGWSIKRTQLPFRALYTVALAFAPEFPPATAAAFADLFSTRDEAGDFLDHSIAGRLFQERKQPLEAIRYYQRCLALDPDNAVVLFRLGECAIDRRAYEAAQDCFERARAADPAQRLDTEFQLGRVYYYLERKRDSIAMYERSLAREDHSVTRANLAVVHHELGDLKDAYRHANQAVKLDRENKHAQKVLGDVMTTWMSKLTD